MSSANHLRKLALSALETDRVISVTSDDRVVDCKAPPEVSQATVVDYGPIVGVVCPTGARAVAYPIDVAITAPVGRIGATIGLAVPRRGSPMIVGSDRLELHPNQSSSTMIDLGLRSLGLPSPSPDFLLIQLLDRIWLDRVLRAVLDSDLGIPPTWRRLGSLHPALPTLTHPDRLSIVRQRFTGTWESLRFQVAQARIRWTGMAPGIADWLDEGSFSRWCIADTPDPDPVLTDLAELLDPAIFSRLRQTLSLGPAGSSEADLLGHGSEL